MTLKRVRVSEAPFLLLSSFLGIKEALHHSMVCVLQWTELGGLGECGKGPRQARRDERRPSVHESPTMQATAVVQRAVIAG